MRMRWTAYAGVSTTLAAGVIVKALAQRPNFYSAAVYLAQSSANLMIMCNLVFMLACGSLLLLQKILYGPLRPIEIEQLYEKAWFAVTETCLAMTIFRGDIGASFLIMFFALLAGKVWGWIGEGRVEILEQQPPANPRLFHTRLMVSLLLSVAFDMTMLDYIVKEVVGMARPDMMVMFGFEFAVLTVLSLSTLARYAISLVEILIIRTQKEKRVGEIRQERRDARAANAPTQTETQLATEQVTGATEVQQSGTIPTAEPAPPTGPSPDDPVDDADVEVEGWEDKGRYVFYLDLVTDFFKLVIYLTFFCILLVFYGLPIHIMRDVFLTCRSFFKRIADFIRYRTATRDMNERYPDATPEDIGREDVCIICREEMRPVAPPVVGAEGTAPPVNPVVERMRPKKLPCGHILHFSCLRSWLERQQICPTCRRPVVPTAAQQIRIGGQNPPAMPGLAGQNDAQLGAVQPQQPQGRGADGQNRARVFQLGPLRIGVGAGRGMFGDLVQEIHNGEEVPAQERNVNDPQQYGFGFGIGRGPRRTRRDRPATVHGQIDEAQRQIQQEIENLRLATNELQIVRMLQGELERLRGLRQAGTDDGTAASTGPHTPASALGGRSTALMANVHENILQAGSQNLPAGLTLPEGWTMMPLHRINQPQAPGQGLTHSAMQATNSLNGTSANRQPVPVNAMFSGLPASWAPSQPGQQIQAPPSQTNGITHEDFHRAQPPEQASSNTTVAPARPSTITPEGLRNQLTGFSQALDRLGASPVPPPQSHSDSTSAVNGSGSPAVPLPSIPSWGSSTPLADPVAARPASETPSTIAEAAQGHTSRSSLPDEGNSAKEDGAHPTTNGGGSGESEEGAPDESPRLKGKSATVEDFSEDPDGQVRSQRSSSTI